MKIGHQTCDLLLAPPLRAASVSLFVIEQVTLKTSD